MTEPISVDEARLLGGLLRRFDVWEARRWEDIPASVLRQSAAQAMGRVVRDVDLDALRSSWTTAANDPGIDLVRRAVTAFASTQPGDRYSEVARILRTVLPQELLYSTVAVPWFTDVEFAWSHLMPEVVRNAKVADAHVHSGGASPPTVLIRAAIRNRNLRLATAPVLVGDGSGRSLSVEPMLIGLALSALALQHRGQSANRLLAQVLPATNIANFWVDVWRAAKGAMDADELADVILARSLASDLVGADPDFATITRRTGVWLRGGPIGNDEAELLRGAVGCLVILHSSLSIAERSSLDEFVDGFDAMRQFRKMSVVAEAERVRDSVEHLMSVGRLCKLELRKTVSVGVSGPLVDVYRELSDDVRAHASGVDAAVRSGGVHLTAQMPVSFLRQSRPQRGEDNEFGEVALRQPLIENFAIANGLARLCRDSADAAAFIGGVDVVGSEAQTPNWVFAVAFEYLRDAMGEMDPGLHYSVHAGEQYSTPMDGLRRVGECLKFKVGVNRIGHGLSIAGSVGNLTHSEGPQKAWDVLQSVCWAAGVAPAKKERFRPLVRHLSAIVFGRSANMDHLLEAYERLFRLADMVRLGLGPPPEGALGEVFDRAGGLRMSSLRPADDADNLVLAVAVVASFDGFFLDEDVLCPAEMLQSVGVVLDETLDECRSVLVKALIERSIVIEACPTSNVSLARLPGYAKHPLWDLDEGLTMTISSDDPGLFGSVVEQEYLYLASCGRGKPEQSDDRQLADLINDSSTHAARGLDSARSGDLYARLAQPSLSEW